MLLSPASVQAGKDVNPQPHYIFTLLTSFFTTASPLSPHYLCLSVCLCQGPHLPTVPRIPISVSSPPSTFTREGHKQPKPDRPKQTFSMVRETQVSLSWLSTVSCWDFAAGGFQHFMTNIFHYIFHFQLSTLLSHHFRLKQQEFCTAYLVQYDLSVSCWKEIVDVKAKSQNPAVIHLQPHPRNLTSS